MDTQSWILLIATSLLFGWWLARQFYSHAFVKKLKSRRAMPQDYLTGLNFLLNEEPDKALDVFIKMLEVDGDTVETHLALGSLFRRRGEVDRAIKIHQNIIARPNLSKSQRTLSLFELGHDYLSAGVLDRAERVFKEVVSLGDYELESLNCLLDIYEQEKEWAQAIKIAKMIDHVGGRSTYTMIAHYFCELSEEQIADNNIDQGYLYLKHALLADKNCIRAILIKSNLDIENADYKLALKNLSRIKTIDPSLLIQAINPIIKSYDALGDHEGLFAFFDECMNDYPNIPLVYDLSKALKDISASSYPAEDIKNHVRHYPSIEGVKLFLELQLSKPELQNNSDLKILHDLIEQILHDKPLYRCNHCGFSGKSLHWHCPGCKRWGSMSAVKYVLHKEVTCEI